MEIELTWHQATEGNSSLTNKVPSNWVVIPDKEPHQNHLSHVKGEGQRLLPNRIKAWGEKCVRTKIIAAVPQQSENHICCTIYRVHLYR